MKVSQAMQAAQRAIILFGICFLPFVTNPAHATPSEKAVLALEQLARSGSSRAQYELARRFETGVGVKVDYDKAFVLYCQSANQGLGDAADRLARLYLAGNGVKRDKTAAAGWIKRAIELGNSESIELLSHVSDVGTIPPAMCFAGGSVQPTAELVPPKDIAKLVRSMAPTYGLDPDFVLAIIQIESGFRVNAVSPRNAQGLMQLIPETQARFGVTNPFDIKDNLRGGMKYLRWLMAYFQGNVDYVVAAYNAGEGSVERFRGVPPYEETRAYIKRLRLYYTTDRHPFEARVARASTILAHHEAEVAELE
jgi:hypothetical protein